MIVKAKAVRNECLSQYCQSATLIAQKADEARFLALLHRVIALGGTIKVEDPTGYAIEMKYDHLSPKVENPRADQAVQG